MIDVALVSRRQTSRLGGDGGVIAVARAPPARRRSRPEIAMNTITEPPDRKTAPPAGTTAGAPRLGSETGSAVAALSSGPVCCLCRSSVAAWVPHPQIAMRSDFMALMDVIGSDLSVYLCPSCQSNDRERHLWLYMHASGIASQIAGARVLHVAPEVSLEPLIRDLGPAEYLCGDLVPTRPGHSKLDVENLERPDASLDLIVRNHVLEHVDDPSRALREFYRCLAPGGLLIAQTPYSPRLLHGFEVHGSVSATFARLFYGQEDHRRLFGADLFAMFASAGFLGRPLDHETVLPGVEPRQFGCNGREPFFVFYKQDESA